MLQIKGAVRQGFSMLEILIAVAIMIIIGTVVAPRALTFLSGAKVDTAKASLRTIKQAIESFYLRHNEYPDSLKDLVRRPTNEELAKNWIEPYFEEKQLLDPWKNKYQYHKTPGQQYSYELYSYGPKGKKSAKNEHINAWDM